jgi:predicted phage baseplate assembly protein
MGTLTDGPWREVPYWDQIGPHDRAFVLDPVQGRIAFGDGRIGRVPPAGARLACRYRVGGGRAGNVAAGSLVQVPGWPLEVRQPAAAFGGAEVETLDEARARALAFLAGPQRAVTLGDLETLALATPGVPVAHARALAGHHPKLPCVAAAGSVTLVAVPACPAARPEAGPDFLAAVHRWLAPRCPLTTELHVLGPSYKAVDVEARLHTETGTDAQALVAAAIAALDAFLDPLAGGPEGTGWPPGRALYRSEVLATLNGIPGVAHVDRLTLRGEGDAESSCADVLFCPTQMAAAGRHRIEAIPRRQVR